MARKRQTPAQIKLEQDHIMDSRAMLALMIASAATSWKTGVPYADLIAQAENKDLKADTFFLEIADHIGTMFTMVQSEGDAKN